MAVGWVDVAPAAGVGIVGTPDREAAEGRVATSETARRTVAALAFAAGAARR